MKAKLLIDKEIADIRWAQAELAEEREVLRNGVMTKAWFYPAGAVIEHPEAFWLVRAGEALPADEECRVACGMDDEAIEKAIAARKRIHIHPSDWKLFDEGLITGYKPDGSYELTEKGKEYFEE